MKKLASVVLLSFGMMAARADIAVQWEGFGGFVGTDGTTGITAGGAGSLAFLLFSPNLDTYGVNLNAGSFTQGDEIILQQLSLPDNPADDYGSVPTSNTTPIPFQAGFIYARVFEAPTSSGVGEPLAGTWYYESPSVAAVNIADPTSPQTININTGSAGIDGFTTDIVNRQVVPEPSTLAFLGIGGLALAIRRRFMA